MSHPAYAEELVNTYFFSILLDIISICLFIVVNMTVIDSICKAAVTNPISVSLILFLNLVFELVNCLRIGQQIQTHPFFAFH